MKYYFAGMKFFLSVRIFNCKIPQLSLTFLFSFLVLSAACAPTHTVCTNFKDVTQYRTYCKRYSSNGRFCKAHGRQSYTIKVCTNYVCEQGYERVGGPCVKSGLEADLAREKLRALKKEQAPKKESRLQGPPAPKIKRVYGPILSVAFSPDGRRALSGSHDKTLSLWDVASGRHLRTFKGHFSKVKSVVFSPDGRLVLSGSWDKTLRVWDAATGRHLRTLEGHSGAVTSVAFSPDGRMVFSGSNDRTLRLWEVSTGRHLRTLDGKSHGIRYGIYNMAFSPDGRMALSGGGFRRFDNYVSVWEVSTGKVLRKLEGHSRPVTSVAFSPDGRLILSGSKDQTLRLWEVATGRHLRTLKKLSNGPPKAK